MVKVETFSVSQSEIQITWEPFGQHSDGVKFNLYRYHNGSNDYEQKFEDLNINQLPFIDTGKVIIPFSSHEHQFYCLTCAFRSNPSPHFTLEILKLQFYE